MTSPEPGQPNRQDHPWKARLIGRGPSIAFFGLIIAGWYGLAQVVPENKKILVPLPHEIWQKAIADSGTRGDLFEALINTTKSSLTGLGIAMLLGIAFAVAMSQARWVERGFFPWAVVLQTVPTLALVPLIGVWFGFGFRSRVIVVVLLAIFPIITNTLFGLQSVDDRMHDLLTLHNAGRLRRLFRLQFPAAMPAMFTGFRIAAGLSVIGAIVGEFFFGRGDRGLGILVNKYRGLLEIEELYATIILSSILGITIFSAFTWLGRVVVGNWHESAAGEL